MILIPLFMLYIFYLCGGFKKLLELAIINSGDENPPPLPKYFEETADDEGDEPEEIEPEKTAGDEIEPTKQPQELPKLKPYNPPKDPEREKLEETAAGMLTACGCKYNTYHYCEQLTDIELMKIIADFNLNR